MTAPASAGLEYCVQTMEPPDDSWRSCYMHGAKKLNTKHILEAGGVAQWLERRSLTGELSLIYAGLIFG